MDVCCVLGGGGLDKNSLSEMCTALLFSQGPIICCENVGVCVCWEIQLLYTGPKPVMML